jgi:NAD(P)-dependent dehydrogenase (short-subunit alcohol dehydrogenase family)
MSQPIAWVIGVGPGLGAALTRAFADTGHRVIAGARTPRGLGALASDPRVQFEAVDVADPASIAAMTARALEHDAPAVAVYNAGAFVRKSALELTAAEVEHTWRVGCLGGLLALQPAARAMAARGSGTLIFTGATAALRGGAKFAAFAISKFGLRALAQSLARELGPAGVHVAHVVIDGGIGEGERALAPADIARAYVELHAQPRSAWTHELDLRPFGETF